MEFNSFLFPAPKCTWDKDDYDGEMVWVPAPKSNLTWDKFKKILDIKKERGSNSKEMGVLVKDKGLGNLSERMSNETRSDHSSKNHIFDLYQTDFTDEMDETNAKDGAISSSIKYFTDEHGAVLDRKPQTPSMTYLNSTIESDFSEITGRGPKNKINNIRNSVIGDRGSINQDKFCPPESNADPKKTDEFVEMYIDHHIPCLLICPELKSDKILIFFHANAEDVSHAYIFCSHLRQKLNMYILIVEYQGYGVYKGSASEEVVYQDSLHVQNYLQYILNFKSKNIFAMGRSIGSGPACYLTSIKKIGALCLISAFTSIKNTVKDAYGSIASALVKESFPNIKWIKGCKCPVLFIHGNEDKTVPAHHSRTLYEICTTPCEIVIFRDMNHQFFNVLACIIEPLQEFFTKFKVNLNVCELTIRWPKYLFYEPQVLDQAHGSATASQHRGDQATWAIPNHFRSQKFDLDF